MISWKVGFCVEVLLVVIGRTRKDGKPRILLAFSLIWQSALGALRASQKDLLVKRHDWWVLLLRRNVISCRASRRN
jgi:hypothetical protein